MSENVTFYPKVRAVGHREIQELLEDGVIIQEKVDGSNFSFGKDAQGKLFCLSRSQRLVLDDPEKMFKPAVDYVISISPSIPPGYIFRCEYLKSPKHNVLAYQRIPKNHLVLFEIERLGQEGQFVNCGDSRESLLNWGLHLGIDVVPELFRGPVQGYPDLLGLVEKFFAKESCLGGQLEGVVIKNFKRFSVHGHILVGKIVRDEFKEQHQHVKTAERPSPLDAIGVSFGGPARWQKAVQRLTEEGRIVGAPEDIPALLKRVQQDVEEEAIEEIKEALWKQFKGVVFKGVRRGLPEWYKEKLTQKLVENCVKPGGGEIT